MRYVVGVQVPNPTGVDLGLFVQGEYGNCFILSKWNADKDLSHCRIPVFNSAESGTKYIKKLSRIYKGDFHRSAKKNNYDISKYRFFLLKLDSVKMKNIKLNEDERPLRKIWDYPDAHKYLFEIKK